MRHDTPGAQPVPRRGVVTSPLLGCDDAAVLTPAESAEKARRQFASALEWDARDIAAKLVAVGTAEELTVADTSQGARRKVIRQGDGALSTSVVLPDIPIRLLGCLARPGAAARRHQQPLSTVASRPQDGYGGNHPHLADELARVWLSVCGPTGGGCILVKSVGPWWPEFCK